MVAAIIIGIIVLIIIINVSSNNRRQREEAERQARLRQQREEAERQARLKREREEAERKRKEAELKRLDELNNETIIVVYESVDENNKPKAIVKRSNNTYASVERPSERFEVSEKIRLAKETINKWNWYDEITYQREVAKRRQADLIIEQERIKKQQEDLKKLREQEERERQANLIREQILEKQRKQKQHLDNFGINYLYHMTHRDNLEKILQVGLKSHNYARQNKLMQNDIANNDVNDRRSRVEQIHNRSLHDYVPLYFNPKNSMLFVRRNIQDNIVILAIDRMLIYAENTIFTDGNAANGPTKFFNDTNSLNQINWECIRAEYWSGFTDGRRERMAEVLVFPNISAKSIQKIYCNNLDTLQFIQEKTRNYQHIGTEIKRNLYF